MSLYERKIILVRLDVNREWVQNSELTKHPTQNSETTKQRNYKTQNDDHYKTANTTKERTFVKNGELTI